MNLYLTILLLVFLLSLYGIILSFGIKKKLLSVGLAILLAGIVLRYLSLFVYLISESPQFLFDIRNLILMSAVSIPLLSYICIIKVNKGSINRLDLMIISVMAIVYFYIIIMSPERIVSDEIGYRLELKNNFVYYLSVIQGVFSIYIIYITTKYIFKTSSRKIKIINMMFFLGYISAIGEGIALLLNKLILKSPVISEALLILAIIVALREIKNDKSVK